jgi:hypothetical protein
MDRWYNEESTTHEDIAQNDWMQRRNFFKLGISVAGKTREREVAD